MGPEKQLADAFAWEEAAGRVVPRPSRDTNPEIVGVGHMRGDTSPVHGSGIIRAVLTRLGIEVIPIKLLGNQDRFLWLPTGAPAPPAHAI